MGVCVHLFLFVSLSLSSSLSVSRYLCMYVCIYIYIYYREIQHADYAMSLARPAFRPTTELHSRTVPWSPLRCRIRIGCAFRQQAVRACIKRLVCCSVWIAMLSLMPGIPREVTSLGLYESTEILCCEGRGRARPRLPTQLYTHFGGAMDPPAGAPEWPRSLEL